MYKRMLKDRGKVFIIDVTNRDGAQTAQIQLSKLSRTMINLFLDDMGVFQSEFGFPTLQHEKKYINANLKLVQKGVIKRLRLQGWCRAVKEDVHMSFNNCQDLKHINLSAPTSDIMIKSKFQGKRKWNTIVEIST
jgi:isopropylmalate/homocitrate/citramalate synthase